LTIVAKVQDVDPDTRPNKTEKYKTGNMMNVANKIMLLSYRLRASLCAMYSSTPDLGELVKVACVVFTSFIASVMLI